MAYDINYNDERLTQVEADKNAAIKESDKMYDQMIKDSDKVYNQQAEAVENYGKEQSKLQQEKTDFAIEQIEQQKDQAHKDYLKEQSGAYVDWQKQKNDYGTNAEQQAASGLAHTGYSESSQVSMYNTYQNRIATARESYNRAVLNYDNAIKDARLQNNSVLAEIAFNTLQKSLELTLQGSQYKNTLLLDKAAAKREIDATHWTKYQNVLNNIYHEMSQAEQIRQYNESHAFQQEQFEWQKKNSSVSYSGGGSRSGGGSGDDVPDGQLKQSGGSVVQKMAGKARNAVANVENQNSTKKASALEQVNSGKVTTREDAWRLLKSLGINTNKTTPRMLSPVEWQKGKKTSEYGSDLENFDNYQEYLRVYCTWAINTYM